MEKNEDEKSAKASKQVNAGVEEAARVSKPTPTQAENDAARLGTLDIDDKEDDGSPEDDLSVNRSMAAAKPAPYKTK